MLIANSDISCQARVEIKLENERRDTTRETDEKSMKINKVIANETM